MPAYVQLKPSRSRFVPVHGLTYHVREWGPPDGPPLVLLHGWRDTSLGFQFVVDALDPKWRIIAPDWRGHGLTSWTAQQYWVSDLLSDLDTLLARLLPDRKIVLAGHSMGGNQASLYAGIRPHRVERLVMLDALGNSLEKSPVRIVETLTRLLDLQASKPREANYGSPLEMARRLMRHNRRLSIAQATFLANANARLLPNGRFGWPHDPYFRQVWPSLHSLEEWGACWRRIEAPALALLASDPRANSATSDPEFVRARTAYFRDIAVVRLPETGHNLHHDAPDMVASAIDKFMGAPPLDS